MLIVNPNLKKAKFMVAPPSITASAPLITRMKYLIAANGLDIKNLRKIYYKKKYKMLKFEKF